MRQPILLAALLLSFASLCPGQQNTRTLVLRGRIGQQTVNMRLARDGDKLSGTYSYERVGQDLKLSGRIDPQGQVTLQEFDAAGRQTGKFTGKFGSDESAADVAFAGMWARPDGSHETYFSLAEQHVAFTNTALRIVPKTIADRRFNISANYPQLAGTTTPGALAFNRAVASAITKLAAEYREGVEQTNHIALDTDYRVLFADDDLISVELNGYIDYGGAHPNDYHHAVTYDLRTGRALALAALFKPGARYEDVLRRASTASWAAQQKRLAAENGTPADDEPIVVGESAERWTAWGLTPRGLVLYYDLPHVIAVFDKVFIPWRELQDVLDPKGPAARFVRAGG